MALAAVRERGLLTAASVPPSALKVRIEDAKAAIQMIQVGYQSRGFSMERLNAPDDLRSFLDQAVNYRCARHTHALAIISDGIDPHVGAFAT